MMMMMIYDDDDDYNNNNNNNNIKLSFTAAKLLSVNERFLRWWSSFSFQAIGINNLCVL